MMNFFPANVSDTSWVSSTELSPETSHNANQSINTNLYVQPSYITVFFVLSITGPYNNHYFPHIL